MLTLLILGLNAPGKDIDMFLRPLVDELKEMWNERVVVRDAVTKMSFRMQAVLLMTVNELTRNSLSGWSGQGYLACPSYNDATPLKQIRSKICYVGHRPLPIGHRIRNNKKIDGKVDR